MTMTETTPATTETEGGDALYCVELHIIVRGLDTAKRVEKELGAEVHRFMRPPGVRLADVGYQQLSDAEAAHYTATPSGRDGN